MGEMPTPETENAKDRKPRKTWARWKSILLIVSLGINLAIAGAIVAHKFFGHDHRKHYRARISGPGYTQILPRKFFFDISRDRRKELVTDLKKNRKEFRQLRKDLRAVAIGVADALAADPYDAEATKKALAAYEAQANGMVGKGKSIAIEFFAKLTPEERKLIAKRIRDKATPSKRKGKRKKKKD